MITLNIEKGLVRVQSWEEVETRPGFVKDLDPAEHKLHSIIGRYIFKERIRCGLSNCHTQHAKGYIVTTTDGHETNIGKDCGKREFGVDFDMLSQQFDRDITEAENRERLWSFSFQLEHLERRISDLRQCPYGADWVYRKSRALVNRGREVPDEILHAISGLVKARSNVLSRQREATKEEIEQSEAMEGRGLSGPQYVGEQIAQIQGMEALYPENDLRALLVLKLEEKLREFKNQDIDTLRYSGLKHWVKWADSVEATLEQAERAVEQGRKLLTKDNLSAFLEVATERENIDQFHKYLDELCNAI